MPPKRKSTKLGDGKRYPLNMRTTKHLRDHLERAADESGRSLAQEVEYRLERSFEREAVIIEAFGGSTNSNLVRELIRVLGWQDNLDEDIEDTHYLAAIILILARAERKLKDLSDVAAYDQLMHLCVPGIVNCTNLNHSSASQLVDDLFPDVRINFLQEANKRPRAKQQNSSKGRKKSKS